MLFPLWPALVWVQVVYGVVAILQWRFQSRGTDPLTPTLSAAVLSPAMGCGALLDSGNRVFGRERLKFPWPMLRSTALILSQLAPLHGACVSLARIALARR